jgi:hypothetical protein
MKLKTVILAAVLFGVNILFAGKYVAEFLEIGTDVRAAGMGAAYCAAGTDAAAMWWNPAAIAWDNTPQLYLMHAAMYDNLYQLDVGAYKDRLWNFNIGASLMRLGTTEIPFTHDDGFYDYGQDRIPGTGDFGEGNGIWDPGEEVIATAFDMRSEGDYAFLIGVAVPANKTIAWGFSAKLLHQKIGDYKNIGFGLDVGLRIKPSSNLTVGVSVLDVTGTRLRWSTGYTETKIPSLRTGVAYRLKSCETSKFSMTGTGDLEIRFEGASSSLITIDPVSIDPHLGVEFSMWNVFYPRIGLDRKEFTTGAGLKISRFTLDYAFVMASIDNVHRVALTVDFEPRLPTGVQKQ